MKERVRRQDVIRVGAQLFLTINNLRGIFNLFIGVYSSYFAVSTQLSNQRSHLVT